MSEKQKGDGWSNPNGSNRLLSPEELLAIEREGSKKGFGRAEMNDLRNLRRQQTNTKNTNKQQTDEMPQKSFEMQRGDTGFGRGNPHQHSPPPFRRRPQSASNDGEKNFDMQRGNTGFGRGKPQKSFPQKRQQHAQFQEPNDGEMNFEMQRGNTGFRRGNAHKPSQNQRAQFQASNDSEKNFERQRGNTGFRRGNPGKPSQNQRARFQAPNDSEKNFEMQRGNTGFRRGNSRKRSFPQGQQHDQFQASNYEEGNFEQNNNFRPNFQSQQPTFQSGQFEQSHMSPYNEQDMMQHGKHNPNFRQRFPPASTSSFQGQQQAEKHSSSYAEQNFNQNNYNPNNQSDPNSKPSFIQNQDQPLFPAPSHEQQNIEQHHFNTNQSTSLPFKPPPLLLNQQQPPTMRDNIGQIPKLMAQPLENNSTKSERYFCNICECPIAGGDSNIKQHNLGSRHIRNFKQKRQKGDLPKEATTVIPPNAYSFCEVCNLKFTPANLDSHLSGEFHLKLVKMYEFLDKNISRYTMAVITHLEATFYKCEVCNTSVPRANNGISTHLNSAQHLVQDKSQNSKLREKFRQIATQLCNTCPICDECTTSMPDELWFRHFFTRSHIRSCLRKQSEMHQYPNIPGPHWPELSQEMTALMDSETIPGEIPLAPDAVIPHSYQSEEEKKKVILKALHSHKLECEICENTVITSMETLRGHLMGQLHKKKTEIKLDPVLSLVNTAGKEASYVCTICNTQITSGAWIQHIYGRRHVKACFDNLELLHVKYASVPGPHWPQLQDKMTNAYEKILKDMVSKSEGKIVEKTSQADNIQPTLPIQSPDSQLVTVQDQYGQLQTITRAHLEQLKKEGKELPPDAPNVVPELYEAPKPVPPPDSPPPPPPPPRLIPPAAVQHTSPVDRSGSPVISQPQQLQLVQSLTQTSTMQQISLDQQQAEPIVQPMTPKPMATDEHAMKDPNIYKHIKKLPIAKQTNKPELASGRQTMSQPMNIDKPTEQLPMSIDKPTKQPQQPMEADELTRKKSPIEQLKEKLSGFKESMTHKLQNIPKSLPRIQLPDYEAETKEPPRSESIQKNELQSLGDAMSALTGASSASALPINLEKLQPLVQMLSGLITNPEQQVQNESSLDVGLINKYINELNKSPGISQGLREESYDNRGKRSFDSNTAREGHDGRGPSHSRDWERRKQRDGRDDMSGGQRGRDRSRSRDPERSQRDAKDDMPGGQRGRDRSRSRDPERRSQRDAKDDMSGGQRGRDRSRSRDPERRSQRDAKDDLPESQSGRDRSRDQFSNPNKDSPANRHSEGSNRRGRRRGKGGSKNKLGKGRRRIQHGPDPYEAVVSFVQILDGFLRTLQGQTVWVFRNETEALDVLTPEEQNQALQIHSMMGMPSALPVLNAVLGLRVMDPVILEVLDNVSEEELDDIIMANPELMEDPISEKMLQVLREKGVEDGIMGFLGV